MYNRIKTGVPGLDELIEGGIPENFITLVAGSSGTGKTTLSMQFLSEGVQKYNEKGIYIGLGEDVDIIIKTMLRFNIDLNALAEDDSLVFANIPALDLDEIKQLLANVGEETKRLVIDPISALVFKYSDMALRQKVRELIEIIRKKEITTIITTEVPEGSNATSRFGVEDFLADGIITLYYFREKSKRYRGIEVRKMRSTAHSEVIHLYKINDTGFKVFPKVRVFPE